MDNKKLLNFSKWVFVGIGVVSSICALRIDLSTKNCGCSECNHKFTPSFLEILSSLHIGNTYYLKCPNCNKRTWCIYK